PVGGFFAVMRPESFTHQILAPLPKKHRPKRALTLGWGGQCRGERVGRLVHALANEIGDLRWILDLDGALARGILADIIGRRRRENGKIFAEVLALVLGGATDTPD